MSISRCDSAFVKFPLMSTAQTLEEILYYPTAEIEALEHKLRFERLRRTRRGLSAQETRLFEITNESLLGGELLSKLICGIR